MTIYEAQKLLFIHIPKTGGTSAEDFFRKKFGTNDKKTFCSQPCKWIHHSTQHFTYKEYQKYWDEIKKSTGIKAAFSEFSVLSIVRNPYARFVSDYLFFKKRKSEFLDIFTTWPTPLDFFEYYVKNPESFDTHSLPQYEFLAAEDGNIPDETKVLKTELLTEQMQLVWPDFACVSNPANEKYNYEDYLTPELIQRINELYQKDFELFGYTMK